LGLRRKKGDTMSKMFLFLVLVSTMATTPMTASADEGQPSPKLIACRKAHQPKPEDMFPCIKTHTCPSNNMTATQDQLDAFNAKVTAYCLGRLKQGK
jgi:hypothetical protein